MPSSRSKRKKQLDEGQKAQVREAFAAFDSDGSGAIDAEELQSAMEALGFNPGPEAIKGMIAHVDDDGGGTVEYKEFEQMMTILILGPDEDQTDEPPKRKKKHFNLSSEQRREIRQAFEAFDTDGSGRIDAEELMRAMKMLGMKPSKQEVRAMIDSVDDDNSGEMEFPEFLEMMATMMGCAEDDTDKRRGKDKSRTKPVDEDINEDMPTALLAACRAGNLDKAKKARPSPSKRSRRAAWRGHQCGG